MEVKPTVKKGDPKPGEEREFAITDAVKMRFCWVPAGTATLGSPVGEKDRSNDETEHQFVTLGFWLGKYEVMQGQYEAVIDKNPSYHSATGNGKEKVLGVDTTRFPVDKVSWIDCQTFLATAKKAGRGSGVEFRLPSEDEWEYACRGGQGNKQRFHVGNDLENSQANFGDNISQTTQVGRYSRVTRHIWGVCDMHGNVREWCSDLSSDTSYRITKGGSWGDDCTKCRSAYHISFDPTFRDVDLGFRVSAVPMDQ